MARIAPLSGFPEHLPDAYLVEQLIIDSLRRTFELHGFAGIETRAVEPLDQLLRKGETSKEVYVVSRLQDMGGAHSSSTTTTKAPLGLHFDLTVPFARYVLENAGKLQFPFRRYQIARVWRGERPQDGRFREFIQADIDVVGQNTLPAHYEVELPLVMVDAFAKLRDMGVPPIKMLVNNRKVSQGFYEGLGLIDVEAVLRCIDKLDKAGPGVVAELLQSEAGATAEQAAACLELAQINGPGAAALDAAWQVARAHGAATPLFETGMAELAELLTAAERVAREHGVDSVVVADFKVARGLDYYTGSVYETLLVGHEDLGSICSGGRYDALAVDGKTSYPGVGLSIGVSRLVARLLRAGLVEASRPTATVALVAVNSEAERAASEAVATKLRTRGIAVEVAPAAAKFGKQIQFAQRRGIPYVWFVGAEGASDQVKDIRDGAQVAADAGSWAPPEADARISLRPVSSTSDDDDSRAP